MSTFKYFNNWKKVNIKILHYDNKLITNVTDNIRDNIL